MGTERTVALAKALASMFAADLVARLGAVPLRNDYEVQGHAINHLLVLGENLKTDPIFADEFVLAFKAAIADHVYN